MTDMKIVLASGSPRRRELMKLIALEFIVCPPDIDESLIDESDPVRFAVEAAVLKAQAAAERFPEATVIGADTVVAIGGQILGKPADRAEARSMLGLLSGHRHRVITGVALFRGRDERQLADWELTYVTFNRLTPEMIDSYLDRGDFHDKAGAYAVQDVGDAFVRRIKGDYENVVGFPVRKVRRMLDLFLRPPVMARVERSAFPERGGWALDGGRELFIPDAVPGDEVEALITEARPGRAVAAALKLNEPSARRAAPACSHFGKCGGCLFQDHDYELQLELKREHLRRTLESGSLGVEILDLVTPVVPSPSVYGYRNKMEFAFGNSRKGVFLGLRERRGGKARSAGAIHSGWSTVPVDNCPILGPAAESIFPVVLDFVREKRLTAYDRVTRQGLLRHLVIRQGKRTGELMAALVTSSAGSGVFEPLTERLAEAVPALKAFYHVSNDRISDVVVFERARLLSGCPYIEETIDGLTFRLRPMTFFQTNTEAAELLYRKLRAALQERPGSRVLGLYCGAGAIEVCAASAVGNIVGVDSQPENIAAAAENAAVNGAVNVAFVPATVERYLARLEAGGFDAVILDPPRSGVSPKAMRRVLGLRVPRVIYVSCNPLSLARDLKAMLGSGYRAVSITPFDFFPHTPHLETFVILET
jgi:23S rRNA (uracil1939-C5)-methyltransferase